MAMGKIPAYPEFLQTRTTREPEHSFDAWLEAGMGFASYQYGSAWQQGFTPDKVIGFVWRAPGATPPANLLCGLVFPSRDSVGREYPLAIASEIPLAAVMHAPHVLPLALGDFLERAHAATQDFATITPHDLAGRLAMLPPPTEHDIGRALAEYDAWCEATPVESAWSAVFDVEPIDSSVAIIHALVSVTTPVRGVESPVAGSALRLPLGRGGPASATLWLDIVRRLCRWQATVPSTFWAVAEGNLVVALGDATPELFAALWQPSGYVQDLTVTAPPSSIPPSGPTRRDDPSTLRVDAPMSALLGSLSR
jgi:type VI secretion system protein ImpM